LNDTAGDTGSTRDYQPIPCIDHERLEFAALTRQWMEIGITEGDITAVKKLLPRDVFTREGAEWLVAETEAGDMLTLRLDRLSLPPRR